MPSVSSSVIRSFAYDEDTRELTIMFKSRKRYCYREVPEWVYDGLSTASSWGEYFNQQIRDRYEFVELR